MELIKYVFSVLLFVVFLITAICIVVSPFAYLEGSAKASYIYQTQGVVIPWYQAAWLDVNAAGVSLVEDGGEK